MCDFRKITGQIVAELKEVHLADYLNFQVPGASGFKVLASQEVFDLKKILLLVSGIPEETGVWSYTLLQMGREDDSSMRPYFEMARNLDWGIIALNPHGGGIERGKSEYHLQMETVLGIDPEPVKAAWHGELPDLLIDEVAGFLKRV